jgi:hypothetical protein
MAGPSPTVKPSLSSVTISPSNTSRNSWTSARLAGATTPGTVPVGGMHGFKRKTGWDKKAGKGTAGATLTLTTIPPVMGTVTLQLTTDADFDAWDAFAEQVLSVSPAEQAANGMSWYYPGHSSIGLTTVVVAEYSGIEYQGHGMYHASFELIEWSPPPAISIVKTVASTEPDQSETTVPKAEDPRITAAKAAVAAQTAANLNPTGGGG